MLDIFLNITQTPEGINEKMDHFDFIKEFLKSAWHKNNVTKKDTGYLLVQYNKYHIYTIYILYMVFPLKCYVYSVKKYAVIKKEYRDFLVLI